MSELPSGTVTFLFTDIEGSTQLLKRFGSLYGELLAQHQRIIREAAAERGGREIDTQGDSFFFAFPRANAAVGTAVVAQRALAEHDWPEGGAVRVRMGLHTGEPVVGEERYVGMGVHRAARIGAIAHGGQVLLSNATRELVEDDVGGVSVRELGSYRLKDIDRPERLFQLDIEGLQTAFAPLKAEKVTEHRTVKRRTLLLAALAGVLAAAVAVPIFAFGQGSGETSLDAAAGNSIAIVDPESGRLVADVPVGASPTNVALGDGAVWVTNAADSTVDRIDPQTRTVRQTVRVGKGPDDIAFGAGSVWVTNGLDGTVSRIDPGSNDVVDTIRVGNGPSGIAVGSGAVWVVNRDDHTVTKIDPATGAPVRTRPVGTGPVDVAVGAGAVWVTSATDGQVLRVDRRGVRVTEAINVGRGPEAVAVGDGAVWVANAIDGTVSRIDPETSGVTATVEVGEGPSGVAVDADAAWVSSEFGQSVARIDPETNRVSDEIDLGARPAGIAADAAGIYVAARPAGAAHRGGTLTFLEQDYPSGQFMSLDPARFTPEVARLLQMTNDGLTAFRRIGGAEGAEVVPNLATTVPRPTDGGRTYTFRLRPGIRYSTGRPVRASDFRHAFERVLELGDPFAAFFLEALVGARACTEASSGQCDLSKGVVVDDQARTVTLRLTKPDPELPAKLAFSFFVAVPTETPSKDTGTRPLPATGPYLIGSFAPGKQVRLVRNPHFREWTPARPDGYPDQIVVGLGVPQKERVGAVARGKADATTLARSTDLSTGLGALRARYGSRLHTNPTVGAVSITLNTRTHPFDDVRVRRALNLAVDRGAAVRAFGGPEWAQATCQVLPPNFPGYQPYCPYERNLAEAKRLVAASGTRGAPVAILTREFTVPTTRPVVSALRALGYRARMDVVDDETYFERLERGNYQAVWLGWITDYPSAATWMAQYVCKGGVTKFCDRTIDREIQRATDLQATDPSAANAAWARLDRMLTDRAVSVYLFVGQFPYFVSERVGNYQYHPVHELLLDQLWVR